MFERFGEICTVEEIWPSSSGPSFLFSGFFLTISHEFVPFAPQEDWVGFVGFGGVKYVKTHSSQIASPKTLIRGIISFIRVIGEGASNFSVASAAEDVSVAGVAVVHM